MLPTYFYASTLLSHIINHYFENQNCLIILTEDDLSITYNEPMPSVRQKIVNNMVNFDLIFNYYYGCQGILIQTNNYSKVLVDFETQIRLNMDRFNNRRYLIISENNHTLGESFWQLDELLYVSDILVITPQDFDVAEVAGKDSINLIPDITFQLTTHKFVGIVDNNAEILLDKWFTKNQSFLNGRNLYPDKISNQLGRPLRLATYTYEPYVIIGDSVENYNGSELVTALQFALKYNMTPIPMIYEGATWGEIFDNWTGYGILGYVLDDKADLALGSIVFVDNLSLYLDFSQTIVRTGITCLMPSPEIATGWLTPLESFTTELWICLIIAFCCGFLTLWLSETLQNYIKCQKAPNMVDLFVKITLKIWKPFLTQPLDNGEIPEKFYKKILIGLILILISFLTNSYSSGYTSIITVPKYEHPIDTVADMAKSGYKWGGTVPAWIMPIEAYQDLNYIEVVKNFIATSKSRLREYSKEGKFGFAIERLPKNNYAVGDYVEEDVLEKYRLMEDDLYVTLTTMMVKKSSILLPYLDMLILRAGEAGLITQWQNEAVSLHMNERIQKIVKYNSEKHDPPVVKLKWGHIKGAFGALAIGYIISLIVFLFELKV